VIGFIDQSFARAGIWGGKTDYGRATTLTQGNRPRNAGGANHPATRVIVLTPGVPVFAELISRFQPEPGEHNVTTSIMTLVFLVITTTDQPPGRSPLDHHPTDVPRKHVQEITTARAQYVVIQGGTMDGRNCRSPQGVWQPYEQSWESNRSVRIENVGESEVVDPWLSNGRNDFRSLGEIVSRAITPGMPDAEKARALWWQEVRYRWHFEGDNNELLDPVKVFNTYGHNTCGNDSICMAGLWKKAGLRVAPARLVGHCACQVFYDGRWHLMDGDMQSIYLLRDNVTVAGEEDLVRDHDLIRRTHTQGILQPDRRAGDEWESSIYVFEGPASGDRDTSGDTTMSMTLRPGEALTSRWGNLQPARYHGERPPRFPGSIANGEWEYRPDLAGPTWRKGAKLAENITHDSDGLAALEGKTGVIFWAMHSPYVYVGGNLHAVGTGARFSLSCDGRTWEDVGGDFDRFFGPAGPARYAYFLRCELRGAARLRALAITNTLQMAPLALPEMSIGKNSFTYTDKSPGDRRLRVTHEWVERSASRPPEAPTEPIDPPNGGETDGTDFAFRWQPATDPDGDTIADYHFELSARADIKWPLSMSFAKLISRTADAGKPRYTLPGPGLLNPDSAYYWRVRARDDKGVWGPWSETWSFTARGPAPPLKVHVQVEKARDRGILRWTPSTKGRKAVAFRVYASDEKGFSTSDVPYAVTVGASRDLPGTFPANLLIETHDTELEVVGPGAMMPGANKAFYRVVAVDASSKRSGPSDYAAAPTPFFSTAPVTRARKGTAYHYRLAAVRSLGDLRTRVVGGKETMGFWNIERPRFRIERAPEWLSIDRDSGLLAGTPDRAGTAEVVVAVTLETDQERLDEAALKWGIAKVVSSGLTTVGEAIQRFEIAVDP
jgi:hypothetical protein